MKFRICFYVLALLAPAACFGQTVDPTTAPTTAPVAFDEAEKAMARFKLAPGLKVDVFAAEPQLANPVSLYPDDRGRMWIVETFRFEADEKLAGVHDIRHKYDKIDEDLACRTVEDRLATLKKWYNGDLSGHAKYPDRISLLEDTDGDHRADRSTVFDDSFKDPLDGIASGILVRGDDVYFTNIPHLWLLRDTDGDRRADFKKSLSYGYGVRYAFLGHDLHGLRFGPDGRLYFSIGDRGLHVKTMEGKILDVPDTGAVLRCEPDGSNLEIFATGLRNPQELTFDEFGNLFSGDNNCDHGDPGRWVYIVEGGDTGWRIGYQHQEGARPTGPWIGEGLFNLDSPENAAYVIPPAAHISTGPSGCTYYPGTGLNKSFDKHFFLCDFKAGPSSVVHSFTLKPKGAGFEAVLDEPLVTGVLATDVDFGPDGSVYVCDWIQGFLMNNRGRVYRFFDPKNIDSPLVLETKKLLSEGMKNREAQELGKLLAHADMRVRQGAQFELAARDAQEYLNKIAASDPNRMARIHAIWALGQFSRKTPAAVAPLEPLLSDKDDEIRAQSAKLLGEAHFAQASEKLIELLTDPSPRVRFFAAMSIGKLAPRNALPDVLGMIARSADKDAFLRHAGVMALVGINDVPGMLTASQYASKSARMGIVLALRRLQSPEIATFLRDPDPAIVIEAARAINEAPIESAQGALASLISKHDLPEWLMLRVLNANYRLGTDKNAIAIADLARDEKAPAPMRVEALSILQTWDSPSQRDRITSNWRPLASRDGAVASAAARRAITSILRTAPPEVRSAAIELAKKVGIDDSRLLFEVVTSDSLPREVRAAALEAMAQRKDPYLPDAVQFAYTQPQGALHRQAVSLQAGFADAPDRLEKLLKDGTIDDRQAVFGMLDTLTPDISEKILLPWIEKLGTKKVPQEVMLDLLNAAEKSKSGEVKMTLARFESQRTKKLAADPLIRYRECLSGGDAEGGRRVFFDRPDVSCIKCHKIGEGAAAGIGPELNGIGDKRDREYLLTSIVFPNKHISEGFESITLKLKDNTYKSGVVKSETDTEILINHPDKGIIHVSKDQIVSRTPGLSAMPDDIAKPLTKNDLRNLVEFLAQQKAKKPS